MRDLIGSGNRTVEGLARTGQRLRIGLKGELIPCREGEELVEVEIGAVPYSLRDSFIQFWIYINRYYSQIVLSTEINLAHNIELW